ncbi:DEAD/DEAH box helicase [Planomicrobium chinense]|uniref:DEAD/DEAH box helicase n=1 Tax=Planococcus chinensis TaxID=272917 RepID=UPI001CC63BE2|nr:helicase-related protein [Planococcus chinensis]MBZ5201992.1 DEAD/DEAH box helicase [Planococcus chinensis]
MFKRGTIIRGPKWAEPVEVISFIEEPGIGYLAELQGRKSKRFYQDYVLTEELTQLETSTITKQMLESHEVAEMIQYHLVKQDMSFAENQARGNQNVLPLPHQIEAVYSRMMKTPTVRYLLADDPGAGKTIMSGMLISEMMARSASQRVLILVPPLVLTQWQAELESKFGETFTIINRAVYATSNENPFERHDKVLCSLYWGMREDIKAKIVAANYDLVIIDEAHKMAAYSTKNRKGKQVRKTKMYRLGEEIAEVTEHLLLLTATPHKGDRENYRHLLSLLDPDMFNPDINQRRLHESARPFVIRRLKESMVQFDGTPLFPKRTTKTLTFDLSERELELYEAVTNYVTEHFNRAKQEGNRSTSFAMMLLQRRLSSSIEAIYLSLVRRRDKLSSIAIQEQQRLERSFEEPDELTNEELEAFEEESLGALVEYNTVELQIEIDQLSHLIQLVESIREDDIEHKFAELERTLFGPNGLLANGEKLLIFTEAKDTLRYLERRLTERIGHIAIIEGSMNMEERIESVERFRAEIPVMIATDAGGESINLQFCNQMINYDIPWNPNKLEQRMGRIHRIGQKNEVFVFNLVAINTREGRVFERLLTKLETMREDLGNDLVYDFLGEVLEQQDLSLDDLMIASIENREQLDQVIARMEKVLSEEHAELIELAKRESIADTVDLPGVRRSFNDVQLRALPSRAYNTFLRRELEREKMSPTERTKNVLRVSYIPKHVMQKARALGLHMPKREEWLITTDRNRSTSEVALVTAGHPLVKLLITEAEEKRLETKLTTYEATLPAPEELQVVLFTYRLRDGNDRIVSNQLKIVGLRTNGQVVELSPHWLYSTEASFIERPSLEGKVLLEAKKAAILAQKEARRQREWMALQKEEQLIQAFDARIQSLKNRLEAFKSENDWARNSANINKYESNIREQIERKEERLEQVRREGAISLQKIDVIAELAVKDSDTWRVFPEDVETIVALHEEAAGRRVRKQPALGLIDFVSENDDEHRFILAASSLPESIPYLEDYEDIYSQTYIYVVDGYLIKNVVRLADLYKRAAL